MTSSNITFMHSENGSLVGTSTSNTVGIAVGVPITGVLLASAIIAIVIVFFKRKGKQHKQRAIKCANEQINESFDHTEDINLKPTTVEKSPATASYNNNLQQDSFNRYYENIPVSDNLYYNFNLEISETGNDDSTCTDLSPTYFVLENDRGTYSKGDGIYTTDREAARLKTRDHKIHCSNINIEKDNTYDHTMANGIEKAQTVKNSVNKDAYDIIGAMGCDTQHIIVSTVCLETISRETSVSQTCRDNVQNYNSNYYSHEIDTTENLYYNLDYTTATG